MKTSLGMVEVRGFLGAISVADAVLKAADVELNNAEITRGGLTTVEITGDVAAVQAAVEVGVDVAENLGCLVSYHVIPNLDEQVQWLTTRKQVTKEEDPKIVHPNATNRIDSNELVEDPKNSIEPKEISKDSNLTATTTSKATNPTLAVDKAETISGKSASEMETAQVSESLESDKTKVKTEATNRKAKKPAQKAKDFDKDSIRQQLTKEKVVDLRKRAYRMNLSTLKKSEIKFANKKTLVNAIIKEMERSDHNWN